LESTSRSLCRSSEFGRFNVHATAVAIEEDVTLDQSKDREIPAKSNVSAGLPFRSALPEDDVSRNDVFAAELFDAAPFALAVTTVFNGTLSFLVGHGVWSEMLEKNRLGARLAAVGRIYSRRDISHRCW
jgi:hypothetical protein